MDDRRKRLKEDGIGADPELLQARPWFVREFALSELDRLGERCDGVDRSFQNLLGHPRVTCHIVEWSSLDELFSYHAGRIRRLAEGMAVEPHPDTDEDAAAFLAFLDQEALRDSDDAPAIREWVVNLLALSLLLTAAGASP